MSIEVQSLRNGESGESGESIPGNASPARHLLPSPDLIAGVKAVKGLGREFWIWYWSEVAKAETAPIEEVERNYEEWEQARLCELVSWLRQSFCNREDIYFTQWSNRTDYGYRCWKPEDDGYEPLEDALICKHLQGAITLSVPALSADGTCRWVCYDGDENTSDEIDRLQATLKSFGFHPLLESRRANRGGHLWLLFGSPLPAVQARNFARLMLYYGDIEEGRLEIFPKSDTAMSQVRLPLGIHRKPGAGNERGWFAVPHREISSQLGWLADHALNSAKRVSGILSAFKSSHKAETRQHHRTTEAGQTINVLELVHCRRIGNEFAAQCPLCADEGHDKHRDNLRISQDGTAFNCVFGGPGVVHKTADIVKALTR